MTALIAIVLVLLLYGAGAWFDAIREQRREIEREWRRDHV